MPVPIATVDSFTDRPFAGNPAGVCVLAKMPDEDWMQAVAAEMNLSETAFVAPVGGGEWHLRWFTPTVEAELCGHATLAAAHFMWETGVLASAAEARFRTMSGPLACARDGAWIRMDFPSLPPTERAVPAGLAEALGVGEILSCAANERDLISEVATPEIVRAAEPRFDRFGAFDRKCFIVTARGGEGGADFVSRFFAPGYGIPEDPVTGSAHCALGPFWGARLKKDDLLARQVSARGGVLRVGLRGERVLLAGQAVTVWKGELSAAPE